MILISTIPIKRSILTDFFIRNIELSYPYNISRIIGTHSLSQMQEPRLIYTPFVELLNIGCCCTHVEYLQAVINVPCNMLSKLIIDEIPSTSIVPKEDVFWTMLGEMLDVGKYEPYIEREMYLFISSIVMHYRSRDNIIDRGKFNGGYIVKDTHIRFPKYDPNKLPIGYTFDIEVLLEVN